MTSILLIASLLPAPPSLSPPPLPEPLWTAPYAFQADDVHRIDDMYPTKLRVTGGFVTTEESGGPDEEIDFDEGYLVSLGLGRRLTGEPDGVGFGLELEGLFTDQDADDEGPLEAVVDVTVLGVMLNGIVDFPLSDRFSFYAGAGLGMAWMDIGTTSDSINDFDEEDGPFLAWQAKGGVAWQFNPRTAVHFGYRFLNVDDVEIDDDVGDASFELETSQHALEVGLLFGF